MIQPEVKKINKQERSVNLTKRSNLNSGELMLGLQGEPDPVHQSLHNSHNPSSLTQP